ncbi:MAG: hypothetical protein VKJ24_03620 [Synechococcales bacterium]|nr:hypothetical protein [Synechococcales bacterium]
MTQPTLVMMGCSLGLLATSLFGSSVLAQTPKPQTATLRVYPSLDVAQNKCPKEVVVNIQPSPYREGGYTRTGRVQLTAIADAVQFETSDRFSVTWRARLKPQYSSCVATAGVLKSETSGLSESLLRMRFIKGNAYFIVDSTGLSDANGYTLEILRQNIEAGNPVWRWGGTD